MAAVRPAVPRRLLGSAQPTQRRWARVHDLRTVATQQAPHGIADKYREKLGRKAREEGLRDVAELKEAYRDKIQHERRKNSLSTAGLDALLSDARPAPSRHHHDQQQPQPQQPRDIAPSTLSPSPSTSPAAPGAGRAHLPIKPLSALLDLPKARQLPPEELAVVWRLRHAAAPRSLCATIPTPTYTALEATARRHPTFVLPVPRDGGDGSNTGGAEMHFLQWVFDAPSATATVLFTQLAEYKARGEWAQPHTSVTHYWDGPLAAGRDGDGGGGVVLMAGSVVDGRGASVQDAQLLVMLLQRFYGGEATGAGAAKRRLLEEFARGDGDFSVERLLEESERLA